MQPRMRLAKPPLSSSGYKSYTNNSQPRQSIDYSCRLDRARAGCEDFALPIFRPMVCDATSDFLPCRRMYLHSARWSGCDLGFSTVQTDVPAPRPMVWMRPRIYYHADGCTCTPPGGLRLMRPRAFPTFTTMATACHCYLKLDFRRVDQRHCRLMVPILYEVLGFPRLHSNQYGQPLLFGSPPYFCSHTTHAQLAFPLVLYARPRFDTDSTRMWGLQSKMLRCCVYQTTPF